MVWYFGETSRFQPLLMWSDDYGETLAGHILLNQIITSGDNVIYDLAFDAVDPKIIYAGMRGMVIKSPDNGNNWIVPLFIHPWAHSFRALCAHPEIPNRIFFAAWNDLYFSEDGGQTRIILPTPFNIGILSMVFDDVKDRLYIGTSSGIYSYKDLP